MKRKIINLTPHDIVVRDGEGKETCYPASGKVARVESIETPTKPLNGISAVKRKFGEVEGLPQPEEGTIYIVSSLVLSAIKGREDVVAPDTGATAVRNEKGHIVAVTRFVRN